MADVCIFGLSTQRSPHEKNQNPLTHGETVEQNFENASGPTKFRIPVRLGLRPRSKVLSFATNRRSRCWLKGLQLVRAFRKDAGRILKTPDVMQQMTRSVLGALFVFLFLDVARAQD